MEIKYWEGGLQAHEIKAIEKIKKAFSGSDKPKNKKPTSGSLRDQLQASSLSPMHSWRGYAGFSFVGSGREGEFDLLIVTHCIVLIIELKDWNNGTVTSTGDNWYKSKQRKGRSPVSVTKNKVYLIKDKLGKVKNQFHNKKVPWIDFLVIMTGNADFKKIKEQERQHTLSLDEFLELVDEQKFDHRFRPRGAKSLQKNIGLFDKILLGNETVPKPMVIDGYKAKELIFEHPKGAYSEHLAVSELSKQDAALLRVWQFDKLSSQNSKTPEGRLAIVSREYEVLQSIKHQDHDLYKHCLRSLTSIQKEEITSQYCEIYELPPAHMRFNEFIGKHCGEFATNDRLNLCKLLIAKFADLHELKIAHRDLGDHSIWIAPSKEVALSSFISAYHQPIGTVGDQRAELAVNDGLAPPGMETTKATTPFQMDVYSLGLLVWHILQAERLSPHSIETLHQQLADSEEWYVDAVKLALDGQSFKTAREFFGGLKSSEPASDENFDFDISELEPYQQSITLGRAYREEVDTLRESTGKEHYHSNHQFVKAWLNINPTADNPLLGNKVLHFCKQISKLKELAPPYIPYIRDFGLATRSNHLFLVTDLVEGCPWRDCEPAEEAKLAIIKELISVVMHLHGLKIAHGDLHPGNVYVDLEHASPKVYLIDIPDFSIDDEQPLNHKYSPENIDGCTAFERDNFAVMRMGGELLGLEWGEASAEYPLVAEAIQVELSDIEFGFKDLARFESAIESPVEDPIETIKIVLGKQFEPITILPDNGKLYVQIERGKNDPEEALITFLGIGGTVRLLYSSVSNEFVVGFPPRLHSVNNKDAEDSQLTLPVGLNIESGQLYDLKALSNRLLYCDELKRAVATALVENKPEPSDTSVISQQLEEAFENAEQREKPAEISITTRELWQAVLDTEAESHPFIEVVDEVFEPKDTSKDKNHPGQLVVPYNSESDTLEQFDKTDVIEAFQVYSEKEQSLGVVDLKQSAPNEVRLTKISHRAKALKEGDVIYLRTKQDKASYSKRKDALENLLHRAGRISELVDYFEPQCEISPTAYDVEVTDHDFARYDRQDEHGNPISLNQQQRSAFNSIIQSGPLSLLQGPPGTGKTEFIAAFVHYLVEKMGVKSILLVSQSHEAVNTAAERIRKHCHRLETPLEVVRFSNRERVVSTGLKDVYSNALITEKRELFTAEAEQRARALSKALGLQPEYLAALITLQLKVFKQIDEFATLLTEIQNPAVLKEDKEGLKKALQVLDSAIRQSLAEKYQLPLDRKQDLTEAKGKLLQRLAERYAIRPDEMKRATALARISNDLIDVLDGDSTNYDEFLARSRHLVTGTCVGIGQRHIGIHNNQYDWVIIDEAARSIASELAIAMQSGKRVLLVGDHKQLPPLYSEPHKKAIARKLGIATKDNDLDDLLLSDFARVFESPYGQQAGAQLLTQYRMAPAIGNLISHCFYQGKLINGDRQIPKIYGSVPATIERFVTWLDTSNLPNAKHQDDKGVSIYNRCEADQILILLKELSMNISFLGSLRKSIKGDEPGIGVICMYGEQKRLLRQKFKESVWAESFKSLVKIDTVDSYQGKENRIIIVSVTRFDKEMSRGFLRLPNRINVALSRAMDRLLIVGAADMWRGKNKDMPLGKVLDYIESKQNEQDYNIIAAQAHSKKGQRYHE